MVIVDTTVWMDYFRGEHNAEVLWLEHELGHQTLGLTDLVLCEVLQGIRSDAVFVDVQRDLHEFEIFEIGTVELAVAAAENSRKLPQRRHTVRKTIDCLIATFCLREGHALLHRDRNYEAFERELGLAVIRP
jgi:predicted nucleic acid-binding protein